MTIQRWGAWASFVLALAFFLPPLIHLVGDLRAPFGALAYDVADLLSGPVWAASLVTSVVALREELKPLAARRMSVALLAAGLAGMAMVAVACIRSANRHYHLRYPELHLEGANFVLLVWTTLVAGMTAVGWHFFGWTVALVGSAGWTSQRLPRAYCVLCLPAAAAALFLYVDSNGEGLALLLAAVLIVWQGIILWRPSAASSSPAAVPAANAEF